METRFGVTEYVQFGVTIIVFGAAAPFSSFSQYVAGLQVFLVVVHGVWSMTTGTNFEVFGGMFTGTFGYCTFGSSGHLPGPSTTRWVLRGILSPFLISTSQVTAPPVHGVVTPP